MPIKRSKVNAADGNRKLAIPFGGESLNITYSRSDITPKVEREMKELIDQSLPANMMKLTLVKFLKSWDMVEEDGKTPVPLNESTLDESLSSEAQSVILSAIYDDQRPNLTASEDSENT